MTDKNQDTYSYVFHPQKGWNKVKIFKPITEDLNTPICIKKSKSHLKSIKRRWNSFHTKKKFVHERSPGALVRYS